MIAPRTASGTSSSPARRCGSPAGWDPRRIPSPSSNPPRYPLGVAVPAFTYKLSSRPSPLTVEDYRRRARRAVPDMVWAYVDYGAEDLETLRANRAAFGRYMLKTKVLTGNEAKDLTVTIGGQRISLPVLLAPTGLAGLSHWTGE